MMTKKYLTFDFGASNGRAVVARYNGTKFNFEVVHRFDNQPVYLGDILYWDILRLYRELKSGLLSTIKRYKELSSISLTTWGSDFGLLDKNGLLISNPIHYRDQQRVLDSEKVLRIIPQKELFKLTGASILPFFDLFQLYSLKIRKATEYQYGKKFLSIADLFNYFLTGKTVNEITRLSTSILYNQKQKILEENIFSILDLPKDIFSSIAFPGEKLGNISPTVSKELQIDKIPVTVAATHDTASAVAGIPEASINNCAFISLGTWCIIGAETINPLISDEIFNYCFSNEVGIEGTNIFVKNFNGTWIIQQCRNKWIRDKGENISWGEIINLLNYSTPGSCLIDIEKSIFSQFQVDMPNVIINYCNDTGQNVPRSIGEIARCIFESMALKLKYYFELLEKFIGKKIELIRLVGGGSKNKLLCQWFSNAIKIPIISGPTETTSVGCLLMQLKADGEIRNIEEGRRISLASFNTEYYEPQDIELWGILYDRFLKIIG